MSLSWYISAYSIGSFAALPRRLCTPAIRRLWSRRATSLLHLEHCRGPYRSWSEENRAHVAAGGRRRRSPNSCRLAVGQLGSLKTSMPPHTPPEGQIASCAEAFPEFSGTDDSGNVGWALADSARVSQGSRRNLCNTASCSRRQAGYPVITLTPDGGATAQQDKFFKMLAVAFEIRHPQHGCNCRWRVWGECVVADCFAGRCGPSPI
jgi:hypothetical protein